MRIVTCSTCIYSREFKPENAEDCLVPAMLCTRIGGEQTIAEERPAGVWCSNDSVGDRPRMIVSSGFGCVLHEERRRK